MSLSRSTSRNSVSRSRSTSRQSNSEHNPYNAHHNRIRFGSFRPQGIRFENENQLPPWKVGKSPTRKRTSTLYDAVAGRVTRNGFVPEWTGFNDRPKSTSSTPVAPPAHRSRSRTPSVSRDSSPQNETAISEPQDATLNISSRGRLQSQLRAHSLDDFAEVSLEATGRSRLERPLVGKGSRGPYRKRKRKHIESGESSRSRSAISSRSQSASQSLRITGTDPFPKPAKPIPMLPFTTQGYEQRWQESQVQPLPRKTRDRRYLGKLARSLRPLRPDQVVLQRQTVQPGKNLYSADEWLERARNEAKSQNALNIPPNEGHVENEAGLAAFREWGSLRLTSEVRDEGWWYERQNKQENEQNDQADDDDDISGRARKKPKTDADRSPNREFTRKPDEVDPISSKHPESNPDLYRLPDNALLKAIHAYASDYYAVHGQHQADRYFKTFDETALLAFGILIEEQVREKLGETGDLAFVEGQVPEGLLDENGEPVDTYGGLRTLGAGETLVSKRRRRRPRGPSMSDGSSSVSDSTSEPEPGANSPSASSSSDTSSTSSPSEPESESDIPSKSSSSDSSFAKSLPILSDAQGNTIHLHHQVASTASSPAKAQHISSSRSPHRQRSFPTPTADQRPSGLSLDGSADSDIYTQVSLDSQSDMVLEKATAEKKGMKTAKESNEARRSPGKRRSKTTTSQNEKTRSSSSSLSPSSSSSSSSSPSTSSSLTSSDPASSSSDSEEQEEEESSAGSSEHSSETSSEDEDKYRTPTDNTRTAAMVPTAARANAASTGINRRSSSSSVSTSSNSSDSSGESSPS